MTLISHISCRDCEHLKSISEFYRQAGTRTGYALYCKPCAEVRIRASVAKRREREGRPAPVRRRVLAPGTAYCTDCDTVKAVDDFPKNTSAKNGHGNYCKPCHNTRVRENVQARHGSTRNYHLKRRYGITAADYDVMLEKQGGLCGLCRQHPAVHVDHCHLTNQVRGLLCFLCNQGLGNFRDDEFVLERAIAYLGYHHSLPVVDWTLSA